LRRAWQTFAAGVANVCSGRGKALLRAWQHLAAGAKRRWLFWLIAILLTLQSHGKDTKKIREMQVFGQLKSGNFGRFGIIA
jgi:hypothetical protein